MSFSLSSDKIFVVIVILRLSDLQGKIFTIKFLLLISCNSEYFGEIKSFACRSIPPINQ